MPARGKHRRPRSNALTRGVVAAGTGGAALALPLTLATTANAATPTQAAASVQSAPQSAPAVAQPQPTTYTVVSGDTLSSIAREHDTKGGWQRLYRDNRAAVGDNPALIRPGLKLKLNATKASTAAQTTTATQASVKTYTNNLDGWIRESLDIMAQKGIPGSYDGIHRNIMRESSGNPLAINNWDSNAAAGTPSKGLLQVIDPTFAAYHVSGTPYDPYDPVANITAACNYAADRYGSIDNVFGAY
ncbi:LysM peptidoglycan-binding domain-containing protein [Streptomyces sp. NBC_00487]|uniref:LysM peptidoglycan-binding domain-containing protein n=1 Tax=unclassified Streptomyces TaxID=2593676 RepID=UPI002E1965D9|nr:MULTISPECIES: LysM peptidoglycan-binding domain-containing protein [unclassified Streptomyces]